MALAAGTRLGPYEILEPLGAGGMGDVYRAHDPRLKRDVALKVLPAEVASEPDRLGRFEREAQTLAALNHPHIVTIFSVEEADDLHFLTMELVEGKTLAKVIPRDGLPLSRFFQIAIPLIEAVSAAHEKGIIHRDLKPGNVMVTEEDRVKVLDFGLAKLREGARGAVDTQSPTEPATGPGRILGTAPYMSPEQVQGKVLDHRSDVFALGIMLYEMATGDRPFGGNTFADVASSILKDTPVSVTERKAGLPRDLGKLIKHCLEKEPKKRFQSTLDLANELEELRREVDTGEALSAAGAPLTAKSAAGKRRVWLVGGSAIAALALAAGYLLSSRAAKAPTEPMEITPFTSDGGEKGWPQLSPDGEQVAYSWTGLTDDNWDIYVKGLGLGTRPLRLTENPGRDRSPVWSPDGRQIAFVRDLEDGPALYTVPWPSGQERRLIQLTGLTTRFDQYYFVTTLSWSPDGEWLAYAKNPSVQEPARIVRLTLATLEEQLLTSPLRDTAGDFSPAISPDGSQLAFVRSATGAYANQDVWVQPVGGGEPRQLTFERYDEVHSLAWTPDGGEILFSVNWPRRAILRVSVAGGEPRPVAGVGQGAGLPSIRGSRMVYNQRTSYPRDIWRIPGRGASTSDGEPEKLIVSSGSDYMSAYSPDGRRIAFTSDRSGIGNIWACDSDGSNPVQLTDYATHTMWPRWSPDGHRIVFESAEAGDWNLYVVDAEGGIPLRLTQEPSDERRGSWSHDGKWIYFTSARSGEWQIWKIPAEGGAAVQVTRRGGYCAAESWDGSYLYYSKSLSPSALWRVPVEGGEETEVLSGSIGEQDWALSSRGIYYCTDTTQGRHLKHTILYLDLESGQATELFRRQGSVFLGRPAVSPDEKWILYGERPAPTSELMLVENFG